MVIEDFLLRVPTNLRQRTSVLPAAFMRIGCGEQGFFTALRQYVKNVASCLDKAGSDVENTYLPQGKVC